MRLGICATFRNEAPFLLEWLTYHRLLGVSDFVLYDNLSDDHGAELIARSPFAPIVEVIPWQTRPGQLPAYRHFIRNHAHRYDWVAFIDIDEFLLPVGDDDLPQVLDRLDEETGALLVNWLVFGPSGHENTPPGLLTENYTVRLDETFPVNNHVKTIARGIALLGFPSNPHLGHVDGRYVDAQGRTVDPLPVSETPCHEVLVLNHYFTKSVADWRRKVARGRATTSNVEDSYQDDVLEGIRRDADVEDRRIARFLPHLRAALADRVDPGATRHAATC